MEFKLITVCERAVYLIFFFVFSSVLGHDSLREVLSPH